MNENQPKKLLLGVTGGIAAYKVAELVRLLRQADIELQGVMTEAACRFITPVTYDDHIRVTLTAKQITPRVTDEYGEVCWDAILHNQHDEIVATYDVLTLVAKTWPTA